MTDTSRRLDARISRRRFLALAASGVAGFSLAGFVAAPGGSAARGPRRLRLTPTSVSSTPTPSPVTATPSEQPTSTTTPISAPYTPGLTTPARSIQSLIDAAAPGATVSVPAGVYRETVTIDKPLTLSAQPGAEIRGSDVWGDWTQSGRHWVRSGLPAFPTSNAPALPGSDGRCNWPEQVFIDGAPLRQVASNPVPGQFAVDTSRRVILADDPTGHVVEVTTRQRWVVGQADDVTVEGFTMRHAASPPQFGAIQNNEHSGWIIRGNSLSDAAGAILFLNGGANHQVLDNDISRGGQEGLSIYNAAGIVIRGNAIHDNNTEEFDTAWEAGGAKITQSTNLTVEDNTVRNNLGPGLWFDMSCSGVQVSNNRVHHNSGTGISYEISHDGLISGNACWENGWRTPDSWTSAGIVLNNADTTEVRDNIVAWNVTGLAILSQDRGSAHQVIGNYVHHNTVAATDDVSPGNRYGLRWLEDYDGPLYLPGSNNRGAQNQYWYPTTTTSATRFRWTDDLSRLDLFNQTPGEHGGVYVSDSTRDQILSTAGIPLAPEAR